MKVSTNSSAAVRSPTRIDLAGGTLDLWPLYDFLGDACTINFAIDVFTEVRIHGRSKPGLRLTCQDLKVDREFASFTEFQSVQDSHLTLAQVVLRELGLDSPVEISWSSQSPVGGGLGGSSSLLVSWIQAVLKFQNKPKLPTHSLVDLAHHLEAQVLRTPTGTQDYYPAAVGGICILHYSAHGIRLESLPVSLGEQLARHSLVFYTGRPHHSGLNNFEVLKSSVAGDPVTLNALGEIRLVAQEMAEELRASSFSQMTSLLEREYSARLRLSSTFASPEIHQLKDLSLRAGASAVKICGAGGGGCVLVWLDKPEQRQEVIAKCEKAGFALLPAKPFAFL